MKKTRFSGPITLGGILCAAALVFVPSLWTGDNASADLTQNVQVFAANGVLKFHARHETQYRDLTPGSHPLVSGSFLKTGNGPADILLADNSVLSLDANTEVQIGLFENGTLIVQRSGSAHHAVTPQAGKRYVVKTRYFTARAVGTEYRTIENYPVDGAVTVEWGEVEFLYTEWDPATGQPRDIYDFVPEGSTIIWPPDTGTPATLNPGDHEYFHATTSSPVHVIGEKRPAPPDKDWTIRGRNLGRTFRELGRRLQAGRLTPAQYRQKLIDLLGVTQDLYLAGRSSLPLGGYWIGSAGTFIIRMCIRGNTISQIHVVDTWSGQDKQTRENYQQHVNYSFPRGYQFTIREGGQVDDGLTIAENDDLWKGATIIMRGRIGERTGRILVDNYSETDVAAYWGTCTVIEIRLVDPNGCNY